ncbi:pilus assembly protein TadG-related protein [Mesorhizobium sp. M0701]
MTAITIVPLMAGLALSVDYGELLREKHETLNALDAAGLAAAQQIVAGASDDDVKAYAKTFFETNLARIDPANTALTVTLPNNNAGGGTLKLCAGLTATRRQSMRRRRVRRIRASARIRPTRASLPSCSGMQPARRCPTISRKSPTNCRTCASSAEGDGIGD